MNIDVDDFAVFCAEQGVPFGVMMRFVLETTHRNNVAARVDASGLQLIYASRGKECSPCHVPALPKSARKLMTS